MKKFFIVVFFVNFLMASDSLILAFKKGYYSKICANRWIYINKYINKREDLLSIVAYACLKKRYLTPALDLAKVLKTTPLGRKNAAYITTLFLMKKLILNSIFDNLDLTSLKLPIIKDNTLGIAFYNLQIGNFSKKGKKIIILLKNKKLQIYPNKYYNVVIETFKDNKLVKKEIFW